MSEISARCRALRSKLYNRLGYGYVTVVAEAIGQSRGHVSMVLNEIRQSVDTLDKIEAWLDEQTAGDPEPETTSGKEAA